MKVVVLRTEKEQTRGVLPYQAPGRALPLDTLWFFPNIKPGSTVVSGIGLFEPLRVYFLDRLFEVIGDGLLQPESLIAVPEGTRHVLEMSVHAPLLPRFQFLRTHV